MNDLPKAVHISEEGPREGFQIEKGHIPTARKIALIDALSQTGLDHIQIVSFVNPKAVPGMADAEDGRERRQAASRASPTPRCGSTRRASSARIALTAGWRSPASIQLCRLRNFSSATRTARRSSSSRRSTPSSRMYKANGIAVERGSVMAAFGCNFEGDIPVAARGRHWSGRFSRSRDEHGVTLKYVTLADTMAWATPLSIKRVVGAVRERWPDLDIALHLHDTRGMGIANAYAGLEMGVTRFDASVAGLGGCPFAGHKGAAGNVCTEDLVFMCHEMGIETGIDLDALIECARLAEDIVGHPLPGSVMKGGTLREVLRREGE